MIPMLNEGIKLTGTLTAITNNHIQVETLAINAFPPNSDFENISERLYEIFEKEINSQDSIFIRVENSVISKIAMFLSGSIKRSASIGIAGETASGKSTVALDIINTIDSFSKEFDIANVITRINTDDYYYDRSDMVIAAGSFSNFAKNYDLDIPEALELTLMKKHILELLSGKEIMLPKYDMSGTAIRFDNYTLAKPSKIVISEGLFSLTDEVKDAFDFKIYVDVSKQVQEKRYIVRAAERDLGASAKNILDNASNKAEIHIRPCKNCADIVLSGEADRQRYINFMSEMIDFAEELYFDKVKMV